MSHHLERAIEKLKQAILKVAGIVEDRVAESVLSLRTRDRELARRVLESDEVVDALEVDVEEECLEVLALHQPVAHDLRFIISVLKINHDLERIADLAVNIAERAIGLATEAVVEIPFDMEEMSRLTLEMLRRTLDAMVRGDSMEARRTRAMDDDVDHMTAHAFAAVEQKIREKPEFISQYIQYLSCARHLERIADLATNIAEDIVYLVEGKIVRHKPANV